MNVYSYVPNFVTLTRFPLGIVFAYCHFVGMPRIGLACGILACLTDWLDGFLARRWNVTSDFGKIIDAYADKWVCWILTAVAFSIHGVHGGLIALSIIIFIYDVGLSILRYALGHRHIRVSWYAKAKTTALMIGLLLLYTDWLTNYLLGPIVGTIAVLSLVLSGLLAITSMAHYLRGYELEWMI
ncbi:MAG: CDP-alcohol phosphatidyltransferase family protein, partial [Minisyncoccia bacterium]